MKIDKCLGTSFVVLDEASEARRLGEGSLDNPSSGQQDKAELGLWQLDDLELNAVSGCRFLRLLTRITLIDKRNLDALIGGRLDRLGHVTDFDPVSDISRRDVHRKHMAELVDRQMQLRALLALGAGKTERQGCSGICSNEMDLGVPSPAEFSDSLRPESGSADVPARPRIAGQAHPPPPNGAGGCRPCAFGMALEPMAC